MRARFIIHLLLPPPSTSFYYGSQQPKDIGLISSSKNGISMREKRLKSPPRLGSLSFYIERERRERF